MYKALPHARLCDILRMKAVCIALIFAVLNVAAMPRNSPATYDISGSGHEDWDVASDAPPELLQVSDDIDLDSSGYDSAWDKPGRPVDILVDRDERHMNVIYPDAIVVR